MAYGDAAYVSYHRDNEKVANMVRSGTQDGLKDFKEKMIDPAYPEKMVDGEDIGIICSNIIMKIAGFKEYDPKNDTPEFEKKLTEFLDFITLEYLYGINPLKDEVYIFMVNRFAIPALMRTLSTLPGTGKVAGLAPLTKPEKKEEKVDWWKPQ